MEKIQVSLPLTNNEVSVVVHLNTGNLLLKGCR